MTTAAALAVPSAATVASIRAGREEITEELRQAESAYSEASLELAMDRQNEAKRDAVIVLKRRMDTLRAELDGLRAASSEAEKRETLASIHAKVERTEADAQTALAQVHVAHAAFERAITAINAAGEAWVAARDEAFKAEHMAQGFAIVPAGYILSPRVLDEIDPMLTAQLWHHVGNVEATRSPYVIAPTGDRNASGPSEAMARNIERAVEKVERGRAVKVEELKHAAERVR